MGFFSKRSTSPPKGKGKGLDIEKGGRYDDEDKLAKFKQADAKDGCMRRMMRKLCTCAFLFALISLFFILYESGHIELKINPFNRKKFAKSAYSRLEKTVDVSTKAYEVVEHVASTGSIDTEKVSQFMEAATDFVGLEDASSDDYDKSSSNDGQDSSDGSNDEEQVQGEEDAEQETEIQQEGTPPPPPPPPPVTNEITQGEQQQQPQQGMAQEQQQQSQPQQGMAQEQQQQSQPQQGMAQQQQQQFQPQQGMAQQQQQQFQPQQGMAQQQFQPQQGMEQQ